MSEKKFTKGEKWAILLGGVKFQIKILIFFVLFIFSISYLYVAATITSGISGHLIASLITLFSLFIYSLYCYSFIHENSKVFNLMKKGEIVIGSRISMTPLEKISDFISKPASGYHESVNLENPFKSPYTLYELVYSYTIFENGVPIEHKLTVKTRNTLKFTDQKETFILYDPQNPKNALLYYTMEHLPEIMADYSFKFNDIIWDRFVVPAAIVFSPIISLFVFPLADIIPGELFYEIFEYFFNLKNF